MLAIASKCHPLFLLPATTAIIVVPRIDGISIRIDLIILRNNDRLVMYILGSSLGMFVSLIG